MKLLLASGNAHKLSELSRLLEPHRIQVVAPADLGGLPDVVEDEPTFAGNARKKALSASAATGLWALADDSGLEVDALDGAPGVLSARFAGEPSNDANNNAKLLELLAGKSPAERGARFVCALALTSPGGEVAAEFSGTARGRILEAGRGTGGFGYDPLFRFDEDGEPGYGRTFAELSPEEKSAVSHRARAFVQLALALPKLLGSEAGQQA